MGDDYYNPWTAGREIKRVPLWQVVLAEATLALFVVAVAWVAALLILSLERAS